MAPYNFIYGDSAMKRKREAGVTLIELLVTISLMAVIIIPTLALLSYMFSTQQVVMNKTTLQTEARFISEHFSNSIREGATWCHTERKLYSYDGQTKLWLPGDGRVMFGEEGSYQATERVEHIDIASFTQNGRDHIVIELTLKDEETNETYELRTRLYARFIGECGA